MQFMLFISDEKHFESITIYRPGLLRLSNGRRLRRENGFRIIEWIGRELSNWLDWRDWWSIKTDYLARVIVRKSILTQDFLENNEILQVISILGIRKINHLLLSSIH